MKRKLEDLLFDNPLDDNEGDFLPMIGLEEEDENSISDKLPKELPLLALRNTVLFPGNVIPITVGRERSLKAIESAYEGDRLIGVLSQKQSKTEAPTPDDLYETGTIARIIKIIRLPDGTTTAVLQGRQRFEMIKFTQERPFLKGTFKIMVNNNEEADLMEFEALMSALKDKSIQMFDLSHNLPNEASIMLRNLTNPSFLLNFVASNLPANVKTKHNLLRTDNLLDKAEDLIKLVDNELQLLELKENIETRVRTDIEKQQRDYFLNQQLKTIQEELGQNPHEEDIANLVQRAKDKKWSKAVDKAFNKEMNKLKRLNPHVPEFSVLMNYLELLLDLPWDTFTEDNFDLKHVRTVLDKDHYGLEKVKERILEHLAVLKLKGDMKAPILCLVGPPGVGKTSLGKSIANALDRKFIRMSLGGLHDESEIRGHRKTYIGAMPGRIIQSLKKVESSNPVFILDEIDKIGNSFRGDPSSALLEVLDPEQNSTFHDNYIDLEYDLSKVLFIATANRLSSIQPALRDRMEIINVAGYSLEEKTEIARRHLIPEQRKEHGLKAKDVKLGKKTISAVIADYTRESGVRSLNRQIARIMRGVAKRVAMEETYEPTIKPEDLYDFLGVQRFTNDLYEKDPISGVAVGLAWTQVGGDILYIEASKSKGSGKLILTGNLGDVMKESATTALSFIKANAEELGVDLEELNKTDIHVHVPEGAIPKDGPSAGITMLSALTSIFTNRPLKPFLAMTGEITLRGKVLPVGGIKEKILAARRAGIKEIILCQENEKHILEIEAEYLKGVNFHYVSRMMEVVDLALS